MGKTQSTQKKELSLDEKWREFDWGGLNEARRLLVHREKEELQRSLENFSVRNPEVNIRILVVGQIGAGKSSFINSVNSTFQGKIVCEALADATAGTSSSFTQRFQTFPICNKNGKLPFIFGDIMGLEGSSLSGLQVEDVISATLGHVKENYKFEEGKALTSGNEHYNEKPSVSEQTFCMVYVIAANTVTLTEKVLLEKLKIIRQRISDQGIPQVIVMTKVDEACPLVKKDLRNLYTSKKIKELVTFCSDNVGVPMISIFPVKNYHDEINTSPDVDVLILKALDQIVDSAARRFQKGPYTLK